MQVVVWVAQEIKCQYISTHYASKPPSHPLVKVTAAHQMASDLLLSAGSVCVGEKTFIATTNPHVEAAAVHIPAGPVSSRASGVCSLERRHPPQPSIIMQTWQRSMSRLEPEQWLRGEYDIQTMIRYRSQSTHLSIDAVSKPSPPLLRVVGYSTNYHLHCPSCRVVDVQLLPPSPLANCLHPLWIK